MPLSLKKVKPFFYLLLVIMLAWLLGRVYWLFVEPENYSLSLPTINPTLTQQKSTSVAEPVYLFGKQEKVVKAPVVEQQEFKKSNLNLKLMGVLMAPSMSVAIINKAGQSNSYAVDEEIQRNVVLQEVHSDYVLISNRGVLEKLEMSKAENLFSGSGVATELSQKQKMKLGVVKQNALKNPVSIMRYVRFQNIMKNGKIAAVKVWPRQEKEIFEALGFVSGDELISIGGESIDKLSRSPSLWQSMLKQSQFELTVKRNGQEMPLSVGLE